MLILMEPRIYKEVFTKSDLEYLEDLASSFVSGSNKPMKIFPTNQKEWSEAFESGYGRKNNRN